MKRCEALIDFWFLVVVAVFLAAILAGCSGSSRELVRIPASAPSINYDTVELDLVGAIPSPPPIGIETEPITRRVFSGDRSLAVVRFQRLTIDRRGAEEGEALPGGVLGGLVRITYERGTGEELRIIEEEFALPRPGEILDVEPSGVRRGGTAYQFPRDELATDSLRNRIAEAERIADSLRAQIRGSPRSVEVEAEVPAREPNWITRQYRKIRDLLAFIGFIAVFVLAHQVWSRFTFRMPFG